MKADTFKVTKKPLFQIFLPVQINVDGSAYDEWLNAFLHLLTKRWVDPETPVHTEKASSGSGGKQVSPPSRSSVPAGGQWELLLPTAAALGASCPMFWRCWAVCTVSRRCLCSVAVPDPSTKGLRSVPCFLPPLAVCSCLLPGTAPILVPPLRPVHLVKFPALWACECRGCLLAEKVLGFPLWPWGEKLVT